MAFAERFDAVRADEAAAWLAAWRWCGRCRVAHRELETLGAHGCRRHVDRLVAPADAATPAYAAVRVGTYACCGRSPSPEAPPEIYENPRLAGCVACDHSTAAVGARSAPRPWRPYVAIELPPADDDGLLACVRARPGFVFYADVRARVAAAERRARGERDALVVAAAAALRAAHAEHRRTDDAAYERDGNQYHRELVDPAGAFSPFILVSRSAAAAPARAAKRLKI